MGNKWKLEYKEIYCEKLIEHMEKGYTFESFAAILSVSPALLTEWCDYYPDFSDAKQIGKQSRSIEYQTLLKHSAVGHSENGDGERENFTGSQQAIQFALKNYDPKNFKEKSTIESSGAVVLQIDTGIPVQAIADDSPDVIDSTCEEVKDSPGKNVYKDKDIKEDQETVDGVDML